MNEEQNESISDSGQNETHAGSEALHIYIVTGLSGAGKSTALQVLEDMGYFMVDGLPASLATDMVQILRRPSMWIYKGIALGMDLRQGELLDDLAVAMQDLSVQGIRPVLLYIEADVNVIMRRYATTRRPHPLEMYGIGLEEATQRELESLASLKEMADMVIDTTTFSIHDLRRAIQKRWTTKSGRLHTLKIYVVSFGFKYGVPKEADFVFDLRFLPNPFFVEALRPKSGLDKEIVDYVFAEQPARDVRDKLIDFIKFILPQMEADGRFRLTIAIGCTGGRHRSVATAEALQTVLEQVGYPVILEHRHLELG